jgi:hypothetical protein
MNTCPKCGTSVALDSYQIWQCGSYLALNGKIYQSQTCRIAELERENVALRKRLAMFEREFLRAVDCVDRVFQMDSTKPPPLLPDFVRPGDDKFEAVVRLAEEYIALRERLAMATEFNMGDGVRAVMVTRKEHQGKWVLVLDEEDYWSDVHGWSIYDDDTRFYATAEEAIAAAKEIDQ